MLSPEVFTQASRQIEPAMQNASPDAMMLRTMNSNRNRFAKATERIGREEIKDRIGTINSYVDQNIYNIKSKMLIDKLSEKFQLISKISNSIN